VRELLLRTCKPGISLISLDEMAEKIITDNGATCSFYQYNGFPGHICISVNDQIIHGIPNDYIIKSDDLISFDVGVTYKGHVCDAAFTVHVDPQTDAPKLINEATKLALDEAIKVIKPQNHIGDISHTVETVAKQHGFNVIKGFGGHGCGNKLHEDPMILNYGKPHSGPEIVPGMTLCIEPMLMTDTNKHYIDKQNHWTVISKNHKLTCH
jgi:methionyl aminopeptidase